MTSEKAYILESMKISQLYFEDIASRPEIIIACGTGKTLAKLVDIPSSSERKQTSRGISYVTYPPSGILLRYVHPEARVPDQFIYYMLIDAIKEIQKPLPSQKSLMAPLVRIELKTQVP